MMHTLPPSPAYMLWADSVCLSAEQAKHLWTVFSQTHDPEVKALLFALERLWEAARNEPLLQARAHVILKGPCSPHRIIACVERAVEAGRLERREGTQIQEAVLHRTRADGHWY